MLSILGQDRCGSHLDVRLADRGVIDESRTMDGVASLRLMDEEPEEGQGSQQNTPICMSNMDVVERHEGLGATHPFHSLP